MLIALPSVVGIYLNYSGVANMRQSKDWDCNRVQEVKTNCADNLLGHSVFSREFYFKCNNFSILLFKERSFLTLVAKC